MKTILSWVMPLLFLLLLIGCNREPVIVPAMTPTEIKQPKDKATVIGSYQKGFSHSSWLAEMGNDTAATTADSEGNYRLDKLTPGTDDLHLISYGYFIDTSMRQVRLKAGQILET